MSNSPLRVAVIGAAGLVGGELLRLLAQHPRVGEIIAVSTSHAGKMAADVHPALLHLPPIRLEKQAAEETAALADVIFCAMAHGDSQRVMPVLMNGRARCIVDLGADFRLRDPDVYRRYYGEHQCPERQAEFVYGLPETDSAAIRSARCIANPGCFATAAQLLLMPLAKAGLAASPLAVFAVTGSSGGGATPKRSTHHPFRSDNLFAYKMLAHQHEAEIDQTLSAIAGRPQRVRLLAHSGPFVRGIHATAYLADEALAAVDLSALYREFYRSCPFVSVYDRAPEVAEVAATNFTHLHVAQRGPEVELLLVLDNLVKGAAGQAVQNMNLALGFPETEGLMQPGAYPC
ncbi:MAG: N-acetyl-gamma-glutamyl-phosphate reductase [Myxococcales bacterium]|nr:N-acetyl-gamma-glutamyl-phosphate reductase [Myxococcales bacterium]